jgi:uncharacterized damage-inducible protein DinB
MDVLERLLEHDHWAMRQVLAQCRDLADAQLDQPFDIGHQTVRATIEHLTFNVEFWTAWLLGQPRTIPRDDRCLVTLLDRYERATAAFASVARQVRDDGRLDTLFGEPFPEPLTRGGAILEIVLHDAEHRSELLHLLARLGVPDLPEVDHGRWDITRLSS